MSNVRAYLKLEASTWILAIALAVKSFAGGLIAAFVMVLLWKLGASFLNVGCVAAFYNFALAFTSFLGGSLSARYGGKKIFIASLLCSLAAILCYGAANLLLSWLIVALGLLFGRLAWGFRTTSSFSVVAASTDENKRATAFGLVSTLGNVGSIVGPIVGGVLASYYGLSLPFLLAIPLVIIAVAMISLKLEKGEITSEKAFPSLPELKKAITINRGVMVLIFLAIFGQFFNEFGNPYYFIFLESRLNAPDYILGITQSMISIGSIVIALPSGYLSDVMKKRKPYIVLGSLFAATGVGLTAFAVNSWMVVATYLLFGFSNTIGMISLQAYFADVAGGYKSLVFGAYMTVSWLAGIPAPPIAGWVAENYGIRSPFIVNFIGSLVGLVLLATFFRERENKQN